MSTTRKDSKSRLILIFFGIALALGIVKLSDAAIGWYERTHLVETIFPPNITIHRISSEFDSTAYISSQGLRNEEITIPKPPNSVRVLVIGDSYTYGWGVDQDKSWPEQLQKIVDEKFPNQEIEVVNAGAPGAGPRRYLHTCEVYAEPIQADYVLWALSYEDFYQLYLRATQDSYDKLNPVGESFRTLFPHLYGLVKISGEFSDVPKGSVIEVSDIWKAQADDITKNNVTLVGRMDPEIRKQFLQGYLNPPYIALAINSPDFLMFGVNETAAEISIGQLRKELESGLSYCQPNGTKFLGFIFIHSSVYVSAVEQEYQKRFGFTVDPAMLTSTILSDKLDRLADSMGLNFFRSMTKALRTQCKDCYFHYDGHPTEEADRIIAETLAPQLIEEIGLRKK